MINDASLNCGEEQLLNVCGTRLRVAELMYMGHITFGDHHASNLISTQLMKMAVFRCRDGKAKPLTNKEKKYFYSE